MTRAKPDFSVGGGGIVDAEFIPAPVREELLRHLHKSPLTGEQKSALIEYANDIGQMVMDGELTPAQAQRKQIARVANEARRLLQALNQLSQPARDALHAHTDYLAYGSRPPVELEQAVKASIKQPGGSLLERRRVLMADWANYCAQPTVTGVVVPLQSAKSA